MTVAAVADAKTQAVAGSPDIVTGTAGLMQTVKVPVRRAASECVQQVAAPVPARCHRRRKSGTYSRGVTHEHSTGPRARMWDLNCSRLTGFSSPFRQSPSSLCFAGACASSRNSTRRIQDDWTLGGDSRPTRRTQRARSAVASFGLIRFFRREILQRAALPQIVDVKSGLSYKRLCMCAQRWLRVCAPSTA